MCWKRSRLGEPMPPSMESDIFEHFALEVFRNLFAFDVPSISKATSKPLMDEGEEDGDEIEPKANKTLLHRVEQGENEQESGKSNTTLSIGKSDNSTNVGGGGTGHHRRNSTRTGVNSDFSKYGPWGYLMLGMLLCGGALLICGLWGKFSLMMKKILKNKKPTLNLFIPKQNTKHNSLTVYFPLINVQI